MSGQPVPSPVSPAQRAYSGTPFDVVDGSETIPSDFENVILNVTNGGLTMHGTPIVADGKYVGQRLMITLAEPSNAVSFVGASDNTSTFQMTVRRSQVLIASTYGGGDYPAPQGSLELIWWGDRWQAVGFTGGPVVQTNAELDDVTFTGSFAAQAQLNHTWDPGNQSETLLANNTVFAHNFILNTAPVPMISTPAIEAAGSSGQFILLTNDPTSTCAIKYRDDADLPGSALHLKTPVISLGPGDTLLLYSPPDGGWYEICRTIRSEAGSTTFDCVGGDTLDMGTGGVSDIVTDFSFASTLYVTLSGGSTTLGAPNVVNGLFNGQELVIMVDPADPSSPTFTDDNTSPGSNVRLSTTTFSPAAGSSLTLKWNVAAGKWFEIARTALV